MAHSKSLIGSLPLVAGLLLGGCEHSGPNDDQTPLPVGEVTTIPYPAVAPDVPQVVSSGGPVMKNPKIVVIYYPGDALLTQFESFTSTLGASSYWHRVTVEYGVGPITALPSIAMTDPAPATIMDGDIQTFLKSMLDGTHPEWPDPDGNTIYAILYPATTSINDGADNLSCTNFGGYHDSVTRLTDGAVISYAVLPRCSSPPRSDLDTLTIAASHELIEASTDPAPNDNPAYEGVDDNHLVWQFTSQGGNELADMCEFDPAAPITPAGFGFAVQRSWSNAAASAGQNPCVPEVPGNSEPYVYVTPVNPPDEMSFDIFGQTGETLGYAIAVGESRVIDLAIISSAPTTGPINLSAAERPIHAGAAPTLSFSFDRAAGSNGTHVLLTVTAIAASNTHFGFSPFAVEATYNDEGFDWYGLVGAK